MSTNALVFLDTEFTNLDPRLGDLLEAAWAVNHEPIQATVFDHSLEHADPEALRINRYYERGLDRFAIAPGQTTYGITDPQRRLIRDLSGSTIVAENYGIDVAKLLGKLGFEPWHYRKIELSSVAMTVFDLDRPEGQAKTAARLRDLGYDIPEADHTAEADVECLRACYKALRSERSSLYREGEWAS
jgi:DNA polymerase-3 subunit epsilon